jgi:HPt (histidine-containing phosphotransfer) domain-containing protein
MSKTLDLDILAGLGLGQVDGMDDIVIEVIDLYLEDAQQRSRVMEEALARRDWSTLEEAAHALKGSSGTVGALNMARICQQLEQLATDNNWHISGSTLQCLSVEYARVREVLMSERQKRMDEVLVS